MTGFMIGKLFVSRRINMKAQIHPRTENRYSKFEAVRKATELVAIYDDMNSCEYHKLVQSGELELYDYKLGFLNFETYAIKVQDYWQVRIWIASADDGDFGGWSKPMTKHKALDTVRGIAENVMKDMVVFPSKDKLNAMLREYGLFVDYE